MENSRNRREEIDILKGILIILVVVGHADKTFPNGIIQFIYWFHMPCFFMVSGFLLKDTLDIRTLIRTKMIRLVIPQIMWFLILSILYGGGQKISITKIIRFILGARNIGGVYWYIPCLLCAICIFIVVDTKFNKKIQTFIYVFIYCFVCIDSYICNYIKKDYISFSIGGMCLACIYIAIGNRLKNRICLLKKRFIPIISAIIISGILILYKLGIYKYNMNMAGMRFGTPILNILIPCCVIVILIHISKLLALNDRIKWLLSDFGKGSLIIMYFHKPFLTDLVEKKLGTEGLIWISNVLLTLIVSFVVYKIIFHSRILAFVFGGVKLNES